MGRRDEVVRLRDREIAIDGGPGGYSRLYMVLSCGLTIDPVDDRIYPGCRPFSFVVCDVVVLHLAYFSQPTERNSRPSAVAELQQ